MGIALSGCAAGPGDVERAFVAAMLPHHRLGTELVESASVGAADVRLRRLVFEMAGYHGHETHQLAGWAQDWGVDEASTFPGDLPGPDVARLDELAGTDHDTWWLVLMIDHHRGAVELTSEVLGQGATDEVEALAATVFEVQSDEITTMETLLAELCAEAPTAAGC